LPLSFSEQTELENIKLPIRPVKGEKLTLRIFHKEEGTLANDDLF